MELVFAEVYPEMFEIRGASSWTILDILPMVSHADVWDGKLSSTRYMAISDVRLGARLTSFFDEYGAN